MKTLEQVHVPFFAEVKDGIPRNGEIELEGLVLAGNDKAIWFEFRNFDGIPVHLHIRMGYNKEDVIVVNSYERGRWKREERHPNQLRPGDNLRLTVINHWLKWEIKINDKSFTFHHRLTAKDIKRLEIRGDIQINRLSFKNLDNNIELYQGNQFNPPSQSSFNPAPYVPSSSPEQVHADTQPSPVADHQPEPSQTYPNQPYPSEPTQNSFYPNLNYGQPPPPPNGGDPRNYY